MTVYEEDLLDALAQAGRSSSPRVLSHRRVFGNGWSVQDLGRYGFLLGRYPVASLHIAGKRLISKGLLSVTARN